MGTEIFKNEIVIGGKYPEKIIPLIDQATKSLDILMFDWRWYKNDISNPVQLLNQAIVRAVRRGVRVRAITNYNELVTLLNTLNVNAKLWPKKSLLHSKCLVIDKMITVMGSHNWTHNAFCSNYETSFIQNDQEVSEQMTTYFNDIWPL